MIDIAFKIRDPARPSPSEGDYQMFCDDSSKLIPIRGHRKETPAIQRCSGKMILEHLIGSPAAISSKSAAGEAASPNRLLKN
jgi:hypothetical protein